MGGRLRNMTSVYLLRGENVLLLYRIGSRVIRACYTGSAGGHFEEGELNDPRKCVLRELREETGLTEEALADLRLRYVTLRLKKDEIRQNYYFFARLSEGVEPTGSTEGVLQWFPLSSLAAMDMPWTARAVMDHYLSVGRENDLLYGGMATEAGVTFVPLEEFEG